MSAGGRHLHHYNIGIAMLAAVGGIALRGAERHRRHPITAAAYGSGAALIIDEAALLIDLRDVYWANDGRQSVDAAIAVIAAGGALLAAVPFWNTAAHEIVQAGRNRRDMLTKRGSSPARPSRSTARPISDPLSDDRPTSGQGSSTGSPAEIPRRVRRVALLPLNGTDHRNHAEPDEAITDPTPPAEAAHPSPG